MEELQSNFNKVWENYQSKGWSICRSGAMYYTRDAEGTYAVKAYSHDERMEKFLDFIR